VISRVETAKDSVQVLTESAATHVGRIATIITGAVRDVAREMGEWATDAFEVRDAANEANRNSAE
jgi:chemotaxis response regulator CheB